MATVIPIRGIRYNQAKVGDLSQVVTPPYDIIDSVAQARYYANDPCNIIRLELGQIFAQDDEKNNRYTRAASYFARWQEEEILIRDEKPALYLYEQEFDLRGEKKVRTGFMCGVRLEPYAQGNILPHEETLSKPKADRLQLMRACQANFSPVFGLYADAENLINQTLSEARQNRPADVEFTDEAGEIHRLWVITDPTALNTVVNYMADKPIFIADGHHRYETALSYAEEMQSQGLTGYDTVLMTLVNLYDPGMLILPTHRLVKNIRNLDFPRLKEQLNTYFDLKAFPIPTGEEESQQVIANFFKLLEEKGKSGHAFGMYSRDRVLYLLTMRPECSPQDLLDPKHSAAWRNLDVAILDNLILDQMLGIGSEQRKNQDHLTYTRSEEEALNQVNSGVDQLAFFLNPTQVEEVTAVAAAGDKMPQKSTYFYPKLITGLVINPLGK
ncbi:MAG: DUF1015 domain-containing protein [Syntrophomonadaceae bacterium]|nr:DUF1015 domain-containing protein [Syntrophomonadaceae bacterium]